MKVITKINTPIVCLLAGSILGFASQDAQADIYDFEGLTVGGAIVGQDNWANFATDGATVETGIGINTSSVLDSNSGTRVIGRQNDANFSFGTLSPTSTSEVFRFDMSTPTAGTNAFSQATFSLGGTTLPSFGYSGIGPTNDQFYIRAGDGTEYGTPNGGAFDANDWVRLQLTIDFAANGGAGSGSLAYQNLTAGDIGFTNVAGLQNINLAIGTDVSTWDTMFLDLRGDVSVLVDNLDVPSAAVPEPLAWMAWLIAGSAMLLWIRRARVRK